MYVSFNANLVEWCRIVVLFTKTNLIQISFRNIAFVSKENTPYQHANINILMMFSKGFAVSSKNKIKPIRYCVGNVEPSKWLIKTPEQVVYAAACTFPHCLCSTLIFRILLPQAAQASILFSLF
jgi:hypothetical protein